ncbi:MAG: hypothetical protein AAGJ74_09380 [Pseudomonadota bacterium]
MAYVRALSIALAIALPASADARIADIICDDRETLRDRLQLNYGAQMTGRGVRGPDTVLEVWSAPGSGDWTLVQSYANGRACIVAMGQSWEQIPLQEPS